MIPRPLIGYCTNVHAGVDLKSIKENLEHYAVAVRDAGDADELGVGLWIPAAAARELAADAGDFSDFLHQRKLNAFTINGFPFDNFHQEVVKHTVYQPTWAETSRLDYTCQLADILADLLKAQPEDQIGSISTLPLGWPTELGSAAALDRCGENFRKLAVYLRQIESACGRRIMVAIEPEPGCQLDTTDDVIDWFETQLPDPIHRRHLSVCHDVCHSAVMMESQSEVLSRLAGAGIAVGKVQVSSAVKVRWDQMSVARQQEAISQLAEFGEDKYLHQTGRRFGNNEFALTEDLPTLVRDVVNRVINLESESQWVVHFHVPIFLERFGHLETSQEDVLECLRFLSTSKSCPEFTGHLEIETYAWTVLPEAMRKRGLAADIAKEISWLNAVISKLGE
ncbi:MAG: metabolite traffic protein EboE [Rubripirellula sp.]